MYIICPQNPLMCDVKSGPQSPILIGEFHVLFHVLIIFDHSTPIFVMLKPHVDKKSGSIPILVQSTFSHKKICKTLTPEIRPRSKVQLMSFDLNVGVIGHDGKLWDIHGDSGEINSDNMDKPMDLTMNMIGKSSVQISTGHLCDLWGSHQFFVTVKNMGIHNGNIWKHMGYNVVWTIKLYYQ